jgi:hypothetical protein
MDSQEEKPKNEQKPREVEWTFDFGNVADSMKKMWAENVGTTEIITSDFSTPKGSATRADVDISFSVGHSTLRALTDPNLLFSAHLTHVGKVDFDVSGETVKQVTLKQHNSASWSAAAQAIGHSEKLVWHTSVSPDLPINLSLQGGVGPVEMDLTSLQITGLHVRCGVGKLDLTLPAVDAGYTTKIEGGVGQFNLTALPGTSGKWEIRAGIGSIEIMVPHNTAVRLNAKTGLGDIDVPAHFQQMKGGEFFGEREWKTEGYELADHRLVIDYKGGIGQLKIKTPEVV